MQLERHRVQTDSACIYYQVAGEGRPVVLVHGLSGSARWWERNVETLAQHFRVYVVDLIGFGATRARERFVLTEAARSLTEWMDQVGIERASVVGHSMGGFIASDLAATFPERIDRLVLVDAAALPFDAHLWQHALGLARTVVQLPVGFMIVLAADAWRAGPITLWNATQQILKADIRPELARIQSPTLVVWGEKDHLVPLPLGRQLTRIMRNAHPRRLVVVKGGGHTPMWECPNVFNRVVIDFLETGGVHGFMEHAEHLPHVWAGGRPD